MSSGSKISPSPELCALVAHRIAWERWEEAVAANGITIDRARGSRHPDHPTIIYPIDYGFVAGTIGTDDHEIDIFCGSAGTGLIGTMIATDHRKGDTEFKLIYNCTPAEIYMVNGFINFDRRLMEGELVLRWTMEEIWRMV